MSLNANMAKGCNNGDKRSTKLENCNRLLYNLGGMANLADIGVSKGWLKPKSVTWIHGNLELLKARVVLGWVTYLAFVFWCTLPLTIYPIIVGHPIIGDLDVFNQPYGLPLGEGERCSPLVHNVEGVYI